MKIYRCAEMAIEQLIHDLVCEYNLVNTSSETIRKYTKDRVTEDFSIRAFETAFDCAIYGDGEFYWLQMHGKYYRTNGQKNMENFSDNFQDVIRRLVLIWGLQIHLL